MAKLINVPIKKLTVTATLPEKAHSTDAGYDLYSLSSNVTVPSHSKRLIPTGIAFDIPEGYVGIIHDRSGIAFKTGLHVNAGVIDSGYRGEIQILMENTSDYPEIIKANTKLAQIVIYQLPVTKLTEVEEFENQTERDTNGFGSTDNK